MAQPSRIVVNVHVNWLGGVMELSGYNYGILEHVGLSSSFSSNLVYLI